MIKRSVYLYYTDLFYKKRLLKLDYICLMRFTLGKEKKLKSRKSIELLFKKRQQVRKGALKVIYLKEKGQQPHQIGVSVSKRFFKKAPDRNRIKRLIKEAYRLQQHDISCAIEVHYKMMFVFQSPQTPEYHTIERWMKGIIKQLNEKQ